MIFEGNFQVQAPLGGGGGAYIRRGDITDSFLRYEFGAGGGLLFGGAYTGRGLSSELYGTCQHHAEITQSHTFAALVRLSTTTHNLLTFNISEISSNLEGTFLLHSSYSSSRM